MEAYKIISEEVKECPFCGGTKILYSISKANAIDAYYGQCYCDNCKACGPRVRWIETSRGSRRYSAEHNEEYKKEAVNLWNKRMWEVKYAHWIPKHLGDCECSHCHEEYGVCGGLLGDYNFCPNCGAYMKKEKTDD